jgi:hypothetical protein
MAWRRKETHYGHPKQYEDYYLNQAGSGLPVFTGGRVQRGHGLGNVFSGLLRAAMPLLKSGTKALAKHGMKTGLQIAGDVLRGQKPKRAVRQRAQQAGTRLLSSGFQQLLAPPGRPAKRRSTKGRAPRSTVSSSKGKRQRTSDIFG